MNPLGPWRDRLTAASWRELLPDRRHLRAMGQRSQQALLLAGVTGLVVGLLVAAFEALTGAVLLDHVLDLPLLATAAMPIAGLLVARACLRWLAKGATTATADAYIRNFHEAGRRFDLTPVPGRTLAAVATLGSGGALGYEGPALYLGAAVGSGVQRRFSRWFTSEEAKVLLVAGAAAGVSAIFKAPVTGLVFALEVPYREDLARRTLLPAAMASAVSYVTFVAIAGTQPLLPIAGQPPFDLVDLAGAAAVGLTAGLFARLFVRVVTVAKRIAAGGRPIVRAVVGGAVLGGIFLGGWGLTDANVALGPGYDSLRWALDPDRGIPILITVATMRVAATAVTLAAGGVGGLFIPLVVQGAIVGRVASGLFDPANATLFPVVGIAAFLGAGYRVPLAAVVFVAEFTGRPGFVVPGLIAAVVAQLAIGRSSVSPFQVAGRVGHLEQRLRLPLATVVDTATLTVPPDASVDELFWQHFVGNRQQSVAVVDGDTYLGIARAEEAGRLDREAWGVTTVAEIMRTDVPTAAPGWLLGDAIRVMEQADSDRVAVCDGDRFIGVITARDLIQLDEVLERTEPNA